MAAHDHMGRDPGHNTPPNFFLDLFRSQPGDCRVRARLDLEAVEISIHTHDKAPIVALMGVSPAAELAEQLLSAAKLVAEKHVIAEHGVDNSLNLDGSDVGWSP